MAKKKSTATGICAAEIKPARATARLTQEQAAALVYTPVGNWENWEQGRYLMPRAIFELFLIKTGQQRLPKPVRG